MTRTFGVGAVALVGILLSGCAPWPEYDRYDYYDRYDNSAARLPPPPVRYESPGFSPGADHVWSGGYWIWLGSRYDWVPGRWYPPGHIERRPPHRFEHHDHDRRDDAEHWRKLPPPSPPRTPPKTPPPGTTKEPQPGTQTPAPPPPRPQPPPNSDNDKAGPGSPGRLYQIPRFEPPRPASSRAPESPFRRMDGDEDRHERQSNRPSGRAPGGQRMQVE